MRLFIPTLGTPLTLSVPWRFNLHNEHRNKSLMDKVIHYDKRGIGWVSQKETIDLGEGDGLKTYTVTTNPPDQVLNDDDGFMSQLKPELDFIPRLSQDWHGKVARYFEMNLFVTLPVGTVVKVDRIYIRAGASDFNSVTFRIADSPIAKKGKKHYLSGVRFWTTLDDANAIEFEQEI